MTGTLELRGVILTVFLGALPFEKLFPRRLGVDVSYTGNAYPMSLIDYAEVCSSLAPISGESFDFIEQVADRVFRVLKNRWPGDWRVTVRKPFPPVNPTLESAEYTIAD
ncbi:MAG: dihydroneopterin aldolase [Candidatus Fermentibacteraceae bacterium]